MDGWHALDAQTKKNTERERRKHKRTEASSNERSRRCSLNGVARPTEGYGRLAYYLGTMVAASVTSKKLPNV